MLRLSALRLSAALLLALCLAGCAPPERASADQDPLWRVDDFSLLERNGKTVRRSDLSGKVWVAAFIFTRCAGPCAQVSANMARLQQHLAGKSGVRLVSFTVDPEYDQPAVLTRYAERYEADPKRWLFLTGPESEVHGLIVNSFHLGVVKSEGTDQKPGYEVDHSTKLVLVDGQGRIRGYFDGTDPDALPRLTDQIDVLLWPNRIPAFNAILNGASGMLLLLGYAAIRRRWVILHKWLMLAALGVSALFLASYLYYHIVVRHGEPTRFQGPDLARNIYLAILLSHTVLAVVVAPLALFTAYQGLSDRLARHVRVARWTMPLWLYVSLTGVVVYWMLYRLYPSS